jgi:hypothetical protein
MRRAVLLVAFSLLLAGCSGLAPTAEAGGGDNTGTDQPTDRLGWENGYAANDSIAVNASDGLDDTEQERVVARAMARVEAIRGLEFREPVDVIVRSRENFSAGGGASDQAVRRFDNAKFEALYLVSGQRDSLAQQGQNRNRTVGGFYSPARGDIVVVSDAATPRFDGEVMLAHELVHALQDQHFNLSRATASTRDGYNARNGLIEGDARSVELAYSDRCGEQWDCLSRAQPDAGSDGSSGESGSSVHLGLYVLEYFPYSDGPGFVSALREGDNWTAVNDAFEDPPASSTAVISPDRYGSFEPRTVDLADRAGVDWNRVRPDGRPDHARLGQSALVAMFAYTLYDEYNRTGVVDAGTLLNLEGASVNRTDPFNYDLPAVRGWTGDRLHVYTNGTDTGYVWRLAWESPSAAQRFVTHYEALLAHWGGTEQGDGVWRLAADSPFSSATQIRVSGETVTIVNAPTVDDLDALRGGSR